MQSVRQLSLSKKSILALMQYLQSSFDFPIVLLDLDTNILAKTVYGNTESINACIENINTQQQEQILQKYQASLHTFTFANQPICTMLLFSDQSENYLPYIHSLIQLVIEQNHPDQEIQRMHPRTMLVNQLANIGGTNAETSILIKEFGYATVSRCAIVVSIRHSEHVAIDLNFFALERLFAHTITNTDQYDPEDIYGLINTEQYLIFKHIEDFSGGNLSLALREFVQSFLHNLTVYPDLSTQITVGSPYFQFSDLKESYQEALFLQAQYDYLSTEPPQKFLCIDSFIFEYFISLTPQNYLKLQFKNLDHKARQEKLLQQTIHMLSKHNTVLSLCADALGIHRNTMLNRYNKIREQVCLHPLQNDKDRVLLRAYSLVSTKKITIQAGIIIQPNSVLHIGVQKMAEIIAQRSNGSMSLQIHTLSVSGDNSLLFDSLRRGALDFAVVASNSLNRATDNQTSAMELPFLFTSYDEARWVLNTQILQGINPLLSPTGILCLGFWSMGWRYITSRNTPIYEPKDLQGKKIRIMHNKTMETYFKGMGIEPIQLNYGDVMKALENGMVDCQENPYSNILEMGFYSFQRYITRLKYNLSIESCLVSHKCWNTLTQEQQTIIAEAMKETTTWIFNEQQQFNTRCKQTLLHEKNMQIIEPSPEQEILWQEYAKPLYDSFPHQNFLKKILKAKKAYNARNKHSQPI